MQARVPRARGWRPAQGFELILLDAPCSATGTIRRHPDIWRLKSPDDVASMAALQRQLLDAATSMLAPGGVLLYATCSLQREECEVLAGQVLAAEAGLKRLPIKASEVSGPAGLITAEGDLRTLPSDLAAAGGMDGFYACRLQSMAASPG